MDKPGDSDVPSQAARWEEERLAGQLGCLYHAPRQSWWVCPHHDSGDADGDAVGDAVGDYDGDYDGDDVVVDANCDGAGEEEERLAGMSTSFPISDHDGDAIKFSDEDCDNPDGDDGDEDEIAYLFSIFYCIWHDRGDFEHVHRKYDICVS